ncbi:uncharacterized protein LOC116821076 [Chelonoidis abingdonii]|uniref:uncharacterized protein LOC116821076 n=1 Tax=Chelonoidis abingdonii TaxID=106734 RepID=UPI0013F204AA|nr:uncharacterized protein LOC116821076 isoform X1 [Chelonoidis abingdonii]XP_032629862.1 uncharacterized protein LOC116821076 isoform X1 [Chelonoidis abingdonii]XP_032629863.1 uncharacterized protein LOC116821076 isoform X1 [Chelonoidis abingdonii]XP_032629864.1 uncharacterized protein LOC116821076 isoform X1 [Chelonoidis abingdonii]
MNLGLRSCVRLIFHLLWGTWNILVPCIRTQIWPIFLSFTRGLKDVVKGVWRLLLSQTHQQLVLLLLPAAIGLAVLFFPHGTVNYEAGEPESLSVIDLLRAQGRLEAQGKMSEDLRTCLDLTLQEFMREPPSIQDNAQMLIQCRGTALEFKSGDGKHEIYVYYLNGEPRYDMKEPTMDVYLSRLRSHPEQLSVENLLKVQNRLEAGGKMTEVLRRCFDLTLERFPKEPVCLQHNARLVISTVGMRMVFLSGKGENEINVYPDHTGLIQYVVKVPGWGAWLARNKVIIVLVTIPVFICQMIIYQKIRQCP